MVELTIGSRFYYKDKLCKVIEGDCSLKGCVFMNIRKFDKAKCCSDERHDGKQVYFKEVKE